MSAQHKKVLQPVSGWNAVELFLKCVVLGLWQLTQFAIRRLWKGHRRKTSKNFPPVELTVDSSIGVHCYIKVMGVKYHYVETGPKTGDIVLILGDAPDAASLWVPSWSSVVRRLAENGYHVITLDLRGTGGSEGGYRSDLSPPKAIAELSALLEALGASKNSPAIIIGFGIGGMLACAKVGLQRLGLRYLAHGGGALVRKLAIIDAPHPNLYWQYPPARFCHRALHFIQWPYFPERWLAEGSMQDGDGAKAGSSRAQDWAGALNYIRGAAWWRMDGEHRIEAPTLLLGGRNSAAQLVSSAQHCARPAIRLLSTPGPHDRDLPKLLMDFLVGSAAESVTPSAEANGAGRGLVGRVLGAVAGRGRELTARLSLPALSAHA